MCVLEREREREGEGEKGCKYELVKVCVCVCVREREILPLATLLTYKIDDQLRPSKIHEDEKKTMTRPKSFREFD